MIIKQQALIDLLNAQVQFRVPIYQRRYDWEKDDCLNLLEDIFSIASDSSRQQHFVGSIIYKAASSATTVGAVNINYLIDGQQRLTTLMLILWALANYAEATVDSDTYNNSNFNKDAIQEDYLINAKRHKGKEHYYRLKSMGNDAIAYESLIETGRKPVSITSSKIFDNYNAILERMNSKNLDPDLILQGINKLIIANISLEPQDNAQLIFETVNSTGKRLKNADKVRNYILMNADPASQNILYDNHWEPMEIRLNIAEDNGKTLEDFFFYYVSIITEQKISVDYYDTFKDHYLGADTTTISNAVKDMDSYSILYKRWLNSNENNDVLLYKLKKTGMDKCIPVVLKILNNIDAGILKKADAEKMLAILESYIVRRMMCGRATNTIGEAFLKLLKKTNDLNEYKKCMTDDFTEKQGMPNDVELMNSLTNMNFYNLGLCRYFLDRIEKKIKSCIFIKYKKCNNRAYYATNNSIA